MYVLLGFIFNGSNSSNMFLTMGCARERLPTVTQLRQPSIAYQRRYDQLSCGWLISSKHVWPEAVGYCCCIALFLLWNFTTTKLPYGFITIVYSLLVIIIDHDGYWLCIDHHESRPPMHGQTPLVYPSRWWILSSILDQSWLSYIEHYEALRLNHDHDIVLTAIHHH